MSSYSLEGRSVSRNAIADPSPLEDFGVTVSFARDEPVLGVYGEVDLVTAPELRAIVNGLLDRGHGSMTFDLVDLDFMDASGLHVIAEAVDRLGPSGEAVTICSVPVLVIEMLKIFGLAESVNLDERPESSIFRPRLTGPVPLEPSPPCCPAQSPSL